MDKSVFPSDTLSAMPNEKVFRVAFAPCFLFLLGGGFAIGVGASAIGDVLNHRSFYWPAYARGVACGAVLSVLLTLLGQWLFPVVVVPSGIRGHSPMGSQRFLTWEEIEDRGQFSLLTFRYVRLVSRVSGQQLWLPLFLARRIEFRQHIAQLAPPDCPVLKYL